MAVRPRPPGVAVAAEEEDGEGGEFAQGAEGLRRLITTLDYFLHYTRAHRLDIIISTVWELSYGVPAQYLIK